MEIMPYIDKTPVSAIKDAIALYENIATDKNLDGYTALKCMKNLYTIQHTVNRALQRTSHIQLAGLEEWLEKELRD
jgi:hypothetical protein